MNAKDKAKHEEEATVNNLPFLGLNIKTGAGVLFLDTLLGKWDSKSAQARQLEVKLLALQTSDAIEQHTKYASRAAFNQGILFLTNNIMFDQQKNYMWIKYDKEK